MRIIRPISRSDEKEILEFSVDSLVGMTNLPADRQKLLKTILRSEECFSASVEAPGKEEYYFVLEELESGRIGGVCAILAHMAPNLTYCYRLETIAIGRGEPSISKELPILNPVRYPYEASEVCALYLEPSFRHAGQGRLLSLSRFLFIAAHRQRFRAKIVADMRGYWDQRQRSPFWEAIGSHFCSLPFNELMSLLSQDRDILKLGILPPFPIYIDVLRKEVQAIIGKMHDSAEPAFQMLLEENFSFDKEITLFEGGPIVSANTSDVRTIKQSVLAECQVSTTPLKEEVESIIGNEQLEFRACLGKIKKMADQRVLIDEEVAHALSVDSGHRIRYLSAK